MKTKRWISRTVLLGALMAALGLAYFLGYRSGASSLTTPERARLEEEFASAMSGIVLEGRFLVDGAEDGSEPPRSERYSVESVSKLAGDVWLFRARLQFGDTDVTVPIPVRVLWAGETPVVTLTETEVPGLGTFTARVLFYQDRYTGLWSGGDTGGYQFGRVVRE